PPQDAHNGQESKQARHGRTQCRDMIGSKEWKNYDHLPHRATRGCFAGSVVKPWPRIQGWSMVKAQQTTPEDAIVAALGRRAIVLVGMMGAGKSSIGRRLAQRL